jgi:hypothetical protein
MYIFQINLPPSLQAKIGAWQNWVVKVQFKGAPYTYVCVNIFLEREGILGPLEIGSRVQIPKNQFGLV